MHWEDAYTFVHDRVQEAAYALIPEALRAAAHLRIGRLLTAHTPPEKREEAIFEIVNQLNRGAALITSQEEREQVAVLNLMAGKRAKASTAYAAALAYCAAGRAMLAEDGWEQQYRPHLRSGVHRAECEFLTGELAAAEARLTMLSSRAANPVDKRPSPVCALTCTRRSIGVTARSTFVSTTSVIWVSSGRLIRQKRRRDENTSGCGHCSDGVRSKSSSIYPLMTDPEAVATLEVLTKALTPACLRMRICFLCSSGGWSISAWNTATPMRPVTPTPGLAGLPDRVLATTRPAFGSAGSATTWSNGAG